MRRSSKCQRLIWRVSSGRGWFRITSLARRPSCSARRPKLTMSCCGSAISWPVSSIRKPRGKRVASRQSSVNSSCDSASPFSKTLPSGRHIRRDVRPSSWKTGRVRRISPGSAVGATRAQTLTASPLTATPSLSTEPQCMPMRSCNWCCRARVAFSSAMRWCRLISARTPASAVGKAQNAPSPAVSTMRPCSGLKHSFSRSACSCCSCRPAASPKRAKYGVEPTMSENTSSIWHSKRRVSSCCSWFCNRMMSVIERLLKSVIWALGRDSLHCASGLGGWPRCTPALEGGI